MALLQFLKKNQDSRRIFGQRELKIIEKQLMGINLTQSEKNRLSRDVRKKLEFIREISRFQGEFRLKKGEIIKGMVEEAKSEILRDKLASRVKKIILFGSTAENWRTFRSDIDIAVVFSGANKEDMMKFTKRMWGVTGEKVDVRVYNLLPDKIKKEIDKKGRVLYERKNK
jgi:predicted nucleotidyltransferase